MKHAHQYIQPRLYGFLTVFLTLAVTVFLAPSSAKAVCVDGLPCVLPGIPNTNNFDNIVPQNLTIPNADKNTSGACDANFMNQIHARAFLNVLRESNEIQTIIRKPDSVLQYTCYDRFVGSAAQMTPAIFSETGYWSSDGNGSEIDLDGPSLDAQLFNEDVDPVNLNVTMVQNGYGMKENLEDIVLTGLEDYSNDNFPTFLLGGSALNLSNILSGAISSVLGVYSCNAMDSVWEYARCDNYDETDILSDLGLDSVLDTRVFPNICTPSEYAVLKPQYKNVAENADWSYAQFDPVTIDHRDYLEAQSCSDPRPTGVMVQTYQYNQDISGTINTIINPPYAEKFCITPGCFYDPDDNACKKQP